MTKFIRGTTGKRMYKTSAICSICGHELYKTRLNNRLFCRVCWIYAKPRKKLDDIKRIMEGEGRSRISMFRFI